MSSEKEVRVSHGQRKSEADNGWEVRTPRGIDSFDDEVPRCGDGLLGKIRFVVRELHGIRRQPGDGGG